MNIQRLLELKYPDQEWAIGDTYESLAWGEKNSKEKPSLEELTSLWSSSDLQLEIHNLEVIESRKTEILSSWPIHKQFEALTEFHMEKPGKLDELLSFVVAVKEKYPKS